MAGTDVPLEFQKICKRNGLSLSDSQLNLLARFVDGLIEWNTKINLISRRDQENIWVSHVLHSLALLFYLELPGGIRILDLGTGGGFPGIPIAIVRPDVNVVLLDSIQKKTRVVLDLVERLGLTRVSVWTGRAEEIHRTKGAGGTFDLVLARAVGGLSDLVRWSRPFLKVSHASPELSLVGPRIMLSSPVLVALKGGDLEKEIAQTKIKEPVRFIRTMRMSFEGSFELGLEDKKAVIVGI